MATATMVATTVAVTGTVAQPRPPDLSLPIIDRAGPVAELSGRGRDYGWFVRVATAGSVAYCVCPSVNDLSLTFVYWDGGSVRHGLWALAATLCFLPLLLRHVWYAAHAGRPPYGAWTLAAMAVIVLGVLPLAGTHWLRSLWALVVSAAIVLTPPWSRVVVPVLVLAPFPLALATNADRGEAWWDASQVFARALTLFVLIWLAAAVRQLQAARHLLADEAVARERHRIDRDLRRTLGVALEAIVRRGERARAEPTEAVLRELVDGTRTTLADARQLIRSYQQVSLQAELDSAGSLLAAAGIETRVQPFRGRLDRDTERSVRTALQAAVARLLRDGSVRSCAISVTSDGLLRLDVRAGAP